MVINDIKHTHYSDYGFELQTISDIFSENIEFIPAQVDVEQQK
ncbi:hypothetical protein [Vibrio jasicida]|nr:hypothetical protein [Vibrio jasicida]